MEIPYLDKWVPMPEEIQQTHLFHFWRELGLPNYAALHRFSVTQREEFWKRVAQRLGIQFRKEATQILDLSEGVENARWFRGASLNIAESCFQAEKKKTAIVYQVEKEEALLRITYEELAQLSNQVANGLSALGIRPKDPVAIDLPMTVEAIAIYLGLVKAGCPVVSIADSFAPNEIKTRLRIAGAKAIFTQETLLRAGKTLPLYEKIVAADAPLAIVLSTGKNLKLRAEDRSWESFLSDQKNFLAVPGNPHDPINYLFSSGTTGDPKVIPWDHTTPIKSACDGHFHQDIHQDDVVVWPTNLGWMMGPWLIFATLINRATIGLYYEVPSDRAFGEFIERAQVSVFGLVPSLVKSWRESKCMEGLPWGGIKCFSSTGECSNGEDYAYLMDLAGNRPVIEYCGGTEIGGGYITGTLVQPATPGTFTTPALGIDFVILDETQKPSQQGELFLVPPSVGLSRTLLNRDHHETYYTGVPKGPQGNILRRHGDQMESLEGGRFRGLGRADDTMNLGGIKVSSVEIERVLNELPSVVETAAISTSPKGGGPSELVIFVVLESGSALDSETLQKSMQKKIRTELNPLFKISEVSIVESLPRTASNKVMRRKLRERII